MTIQESCKKAQIRSKANNTKTYYVYYYCLQNSTKVDTKIIKNDFVELIAIYENGNQTYYKYK